MSLTTLMNSDSLVVREAQASMRLLARQRLGIGHRPAISDSAVRERLADWYVDAQGIKYTQFRTLTALSRGETPGPESSINKVVTARKMQEVSLFALDLLDQAGASTDPELSPLDGVFHQGMMAAPGLRIAGGSDEILRNIIAERVLGLPADIRVDKDVAFKDLPTGKR